MVEYGNVERMFRHRRSQTCTTQRGYGHCGGHYVTSRNHQALHAAPATP